MNIDPIGASAPPLAAVAAAPQPAAAAPGPSFSSMFGHQLEQVNADLAGADRAMVQLATGEAGNLHDVMIRLEQARLSFQLLAQVRNRLLEAYQDLSRMQV